MITGFIGGGNMAEALIKGLRSMRQGTREKILVSEPRAERREYLEQAYGLKTFEKNIDVASASNIIILAVKPQNMEAALDDIADLITDDKMVVSIAAGITLSYLQSKLKTKKLIRVMPNAPSLVQEGMSVLSLCECFSDKDITPVREIFMSIGKVLTLPEKYINAVTALSGSGPAFIALFLEAMIDAAIKLGLSKDNASELAIQTLIGTAKLLDTGLSPEKLREMVTSPGGTTAAGLGVFMEKDIAGVVNAAMGAAFKRAEELGKKG